MLSTKDVLFRQLVSNCIISVIEVLNIDCVPTTVNREYFDVKIFLDSMACAKIKRTKYMRNINDNAVQDCLSENYLIIA